MSEPREKQVPWLSIVTCIMAAFGLFGAGFGSSQWLLASEVRRIDEQGSRKVQEMSTELAVVKRSYEKDFMYIRDALTEIQKTVREHAATTKP